jgi:large subunit ribosomal protein L24
MVTSNAYKQRKILFTSPWHRRIKLLSAPLSKDLRVRLNIKSIPVRVNDSVKVVAGGFKGKSGKVVRVETKRGLVYIEGITGKAQKGKTKLVGIHVSNLIITKLDLSDKRRKMILQRKGVSAELLEKEPEIGSAEEIKAVEEPKEAETTVGQTPEAAGGESNLPKQESTNGEKGEG